MTSEVRVQNERVDDIPVLVRQQQMMGIAEVIDETVRRHGNRAGLSLGWTVVGWLTFILSESDHRLNRVEGWAEGRLVTLNGVLPGPVQASDFTDDRLGDVLRALSEDETWEQVEMRLGEHLVQVYELPRETVRIDTTSVSVYHDQENSILFQQGHSKDHRPDLAQIKLVLASLDPLALPVVTMVVPGQRADDGLYSPAIQAARETLQQPGLLYVGDSKMEALATRAHIAQAQDYYLMPLSQKGDQAQLLTDHLAAMFEAGDDLESIYTVQTDDPPRLLAQGRESLRTQTAMMEDERFDWSERLLLIYSPRLAQSGIRGLEQRLAQAEARLARLTPPPGRGQRRRTELAPLQDEVQAILTRYHVADLLCVTYHLEVQERSVRGYLGRPARTETTQRYSLTVSRDDTALQAAYRRLGWRLYATNAPAERLSLADAIRTYRGSVPTIERDFARLKGRPLGLRPVFVQREDHVKGLARLLSLALRVLTLTEFVARRSLQAEQDSLAGLYAGQPTRTTQRPTTERLLEAFQEITLSIVDLPGQHFCYLTPLNTLQSRILHLLGFTDALYTELTHVPAIPP